MHTRQLGCAGPHVSPMGLSLIRISDPFGGAENADSLAILHTALDAGMTFLDTGDFYGMGYGELLLREVLKTRRRSDVQISGQFGFLGDPSGRVNGVDTRPEIVRNSLAYTLRRIGTDYLDIYRPARLSSDVPVEDTVGAMAELVEAGYVRHIGLPAVTAQTMHRAAGVHPISDLRVDYTRVDDDVLATAAELGIGITASDEGPYLGTVGPVREVAARIGASPSQVAIAWMLARDPLVVPLVAPERRALNSLVEALDAVRLELSAEDLTRIDAAIRIVGGCPPRVRIPRQLRREPPAGPVRREAPDTPLTGREREVLVLVATGMTNRAVGRQLGITERTAREHVARILLKLRVKSRVEAAVIATKWGLIEIPSQPD